MTKQRLAPDGDVAFAARLPSVERVLADPSSAPLIEKYGRTQTLAALRALLGELRADMLRGTSGSKTAMDGIAGLNAVLAGRLAHAAGKSI